MKISVLYRRLYNSPAFYHRPWTLYEGWLDVLYRRMGLVRS